MRFSRDVLSCFWSSRDILYLLTTKSLLDCNKKITGKHFVLFPVKNFMTKISYLICCFVAKLLYSSNPLGLFFCQFQLSRHISSMPNSAFQPSSASAFAGLQ